MSVAPEAGDLGRKRYGRQRHACNSAGRTEYPTTYVERAKHCWHRRRRLDCCRPEQQCGIGTQMQSRPQRDFLETRIVHVKTAWHIDGHDPPKKPIAPPCPNILYDLHSHHHRKLVLCRDRPSGMRRHTLRAETDRSSKVYWHV